MFLFSPSAIAAGKMLVLPAALYSDTPSAYTTLVRFAASVVNVNNALGYQQSFGDDAGGRTDTPVFYVNTTHAGMGDQSVYRGDSFISRHTSYASVTKWVGQNSGVLWSGDRNAGTPQVNVYAGEVQLGDNGHDDVVLMGTVLNFFRDGTKTLGYDTPGIGHRLANLGTEPMDAGFQINGEWNVGLDYANANFGAEQAAIAFKGGHRQYWNVDATAIASDQWYAGAGAATLGTVYTHYSSSALRDIVGGVDIFRRYSGRVEVQPGADTDHVFRVYGLSSTAFGSVSQAGAVTYFQAATSGVEGTTLGFRTADSSGVEQDRLIINSAGVIRPGSDNAMGFGTASFRWLNTYSVNLRPGAGGVIWTSGTGTPEGVVAAPIGSLYTRTDGGAGTTLYAKESGAGTASGWTAK